MPIVMSADACRAGFSARLLGVASAGMLAAGIWRVDGVMGAFGLIGLLFLISARMLGRANLRELAVLLEAPHRVGASTPFPMRATLVNPRRWLDAWGIVLRVDFPGGATAGCRIDWVASRSAADFDAHASAMARGQGREVRVSATSAFPLGLFAFGACATVPHEMLVLAVPRPPRTMPAQEIMADNNPLAGATSGESSGDLRGLRPWQPGDSPRRIAWPATTRALAAGGQPLVREMDPPGFLPARCLLVVHSFASGGTLIRPERFERMLATAAGWLDRLHAHGVPARMMADFDAWAEQTASTRGQITRCHELLAMAVRSGSTEAHELKSAIAKAADDESVVVLSDMPSGSWEHHLPERRPPCLATEP